MHNDEPDRLQPMPIRKNEDRSRYELSVDDEVIGVIDYLVEDSVVDLPHTFVEPEHGGKGYAAQLTKFALDDVRAQHKKVRPACPYIANYVDKHPEYHDLRAE